VLDSLGWRVIRFWNTPVLTETQGVIDAILAELRLSRP
jgi:very-short-patch-repair endonuclease